MTLPRVLYWSHAPQSVYDILRDCATGVVTLDTLSADDDAQRRQLLAHAHAVIVAAHPFAPEMLAHAPGLGLIHHQGVGYHDTVPPLATLAARGIRLALTPQGTTTGVAEHTLLLMLAVCKRLPHVDQSLRQGQWHINTYRSESRELCGMTVGLVGMGRIGQRVAALVQAFGATVQYHDPVAGVPADLSAHAVPLRQLLTSSDIVSLHLPLTRESHHLIDSHALASMKPGAILINASRGGLVDEQALFDALLRGHLAGAGLDCFEQEPPPHDHPLFSLHQVVVTPHTAAATRDALRGKMQALFANLARWQRGEPLDNEVATAPAEPGP